MGAGAMSGWEAFGYGVLGAVAVVIVLAVLHDLCLWSTRWRG